jgi:hypothetical protein
MKTVCEEIAINIFKCSLIFLAICSCLLIQWFAAPFEVLNSNSGVQMLPCMISGRKYFKRDAINT